MQLLIQTIKLNENLVFMRNRNNAPIEGIRTYHLVLDIRNYLDLFQTLYVCTFFINLDSSPKFYKVRFSFKFGYGFFQFNKEFKSIGYGILRDVLYKFKFDNIFVETLMIFYHNVGTKQSLIGEHSTYL